MPELTAAQKRKIARQINVPNRSKKKKNEIIDSAFNTANATSLKPIEDSLAAGRRGVAAAAGVPESRIDWDRLSPSSYGSGQWDVPLLPTPARTFKLFGREYQMPARSGGTAAIEKRTTGDGEVWRFIQSKRGLDSANKKLDVARASNRAQAQSQIRISDFRKAGAKLLYGEGNNGRRRTAQPGMLSQMNQMNGADRFNFNAANKNQFNMKSKLVR